MPSYRQGRRVRTLGAGISVAVAVCAVCAVHYRSTVRGETEQVRTRTHLAAEQVALRLKSFVDVRLDLASEIRDAWDAGVIDSRDEFEKRVERLQRHLSSIVAMNWIDPDGVIRWVVPEAGNRNAMDRDLTINPVAGPVLLATRDTGETRLTAPLDLYLGGRGVAAYLPIERDGAHAGWINVVFRLAPFVDDCLAEGVRERFCYTINDGTDLVHATAAETCPSFAPYSASVSIPVADRVWTLNLCPLPAQIATAHSPRAGIVFGLGIVLALALGVLTAATLRSHFAIRDREAQIRSVAEHVPGVIYTYETRPGRSRRLLYLGPGLETIIGPRSAEAVRRDFDHLWELIHPMDRAPLAREARTGQAIGLTVDVELRMRADDGDYRWLRALGQPVRVDSERTRWHTVLIDITEQKQAEVDLRDTRAQLEHLVAASPVVIYSRSPGAETMSFVSTNVASVVGWPDTALTADTGLWAQIVHPDDREHVLRDSLALVETGHCTIEYRLRHHVGHYVWIQDTSRIVRDLSGEAVEVVGTWQDITERRKAQERQKLMMNELDHRVKNNLASVQALADLTLATSGSLESFRTSFSGRIRAMASTHEALARCRWEGVDLGEVMRLTLEPYTGGNAERIRIEGDAALLPARVASPLSLACHELATNAAKYGALSSATGRVRIAWTASERELQLSWVERDGPTVRPPAAPGFGLQLLEGLVERELGGRAEVAFDAEGLTCTIAVPLGRTAAAA